ncbi:MAG: hypothetical protein ACKVQQ_21730 [Burkholderiales bacterium]
MPQLTDLDQLPAGCYALGGVTSARAYRISHFCHSLLVPASREVFKADPQAAMRKAGLSDEEIAMVNAGDWLALVRHGVSPYLLFRLSGALGSGLAATGAQMRGQTLEEFMQTRKITGAR